MKRENRPTKDSDRILAIDPINRGFGFVVLEGASHLVHWGVVQIRPGSTKDLLESVVSLIERCSPSSLLIEDVALNARRGRRARSFLESLRGLARKKHIYYRKLSLRAVYQHFRGFEATNKEKIAAAVAQEFPELAPRLPRRRRPWTREGDSMAMFDALALAMAWLARR